ncbi:PREDICTED: uncharacterized protein LOC106806734 isoform X2 [Priapulus caudatus]|uniref:Uncharacterized protein LOC106806734 isoform X2 n=1 Tax=Priapulus caudatus TaxID=37621 RepID=A0ABM1DWE3_PRICU|nr:PREDICTED: uncharacterized protein LOC106806734 isoform X2 [Priapulus caudatus]
MATLEMRSDICTWLERELVVDEQGFLIAQDVFTSFMKSCSNATVSKDLFGKHLKLIFPGISFSTKRKDKSHVRIYRGISYRHQQPEDTISLHDIALRIKPWWHVVANNDSSIKIMSFVGIINQQRVVKELEVYGNGHWNLSFGVVRVLTSDSSEQSSLLSPGDGMFRVRDVDNLLRMVDNAEMCKGLPLGESTSGRQPVERFQTAKGEPEEIRQRARTCSWLKPALAHGTSCRACNRHLRYVRKAASLKALHTSHDASTAHTDAEWSLTDENDADVAAIVAKYLPQINSDSLLRDQLLNQEQIRGRAPRGRRWNPEVVKACLTLWASNPRTYKKLSSLGILVTLPSGRLLRYYKNSVHQKPGLNNDMLHWMYEEAKSKQVPPHGMTGGIVFDEMSIQSDLQIIYSEGKVKIVGLVDMGAECSAMRVLKEGKASAQLATHVLLFMFQGDSGFRFPFMHVPTAEATAPDIYVLFWKAVCGLIDWGFSVNYACFNGAVHNRSFLKIHFNGSDSAAVSASFATHNACSPDLPLVMMMDPKAGFITWEMWVKAYQWDRAANPSEVSRIHHVLSDEHIWPNNGQKMQNKLAEDVLNKEMLHLFKAYQKAEGRNGDSLNGAIQLLEATSVLIANFTDTRPITSVEDDRLHCNARALQWFTSWEDGVMSDLQDTAIVKRKKLMSQETRFDMKSAILGFGSLVRQKQKTHPGTSINAARVNSDSVENIFCQQRAISHGANDNPNYKQFMYGMNTIILTADTVNSSRCNTGVAAEPFSFRVQKPINPKK